MNDPTFRKDSRLRYFNAEVAGWLSGQVDVALNPSAEDYALNREIFEFEKKMVGREFRAGVPLLAGTDVLNPFCFPGFSLHDELSILLSCVIITVLFEE